MNFIFSLKTINYIILAIATIGWGVLRFADVTINDDAMITFTYAKNIVETGQFVFNDGEYVYGTTTPLFGLFTALGILLRIEPWHWVLSWDVIWGALIFFRIFQILEIVKLERWFILVCSYLLIDHWRTLPVGLYLVIIFSALVELAKESKPWVPILYGSIAAAFRPDGVLILGVTLLFALFPLIKEKE